MKHVLLVEDDATLSELLIQKLRREGYDVTCYADGGQGLKAIKTQKPDLVLLDVTLPVMDGYEVLEAKHDDPEIAQIPVIIISNSGQPVEINRALSLGVVDYLVKAQMDPGEVVEKVRERVGTTAQGIDLKDKKIFWVEDDKFLAELLAMKLKTEGAVSIHAKDGETALELLKTETPDIILLDLVLPGISGFEVLEKIKADERVKHIPVMILSNLGQAADIEKTRHLAVKHLIKAEHDPDDIMREITAVLQGKVPQPEA